MPRPWPESLLWWLELHHAGDIFAPSMFRKLIIIIFLAGPWLSQPVLAQRVIADITIDAQNIDDAPRQAIQSLERDISHYIENTRWDAQDLPADFTIQATLFIDSYSESGYQRLYTAKAYWGNGDEQKYFDKSWQFAYNQGEQLRNTSSFNSLTSFLDYWVLVILAGDLDTWKEFGGSQLYARAQQIARQGADSNLKRGWKERLEDVEYLSGNQNYRRMKFQYYEAIAQWDAENDKAAHALLDQFMDNLAVSLRRTNSRIFTANFLKAKYIELADFLWEVDRRDLVQRLKDIDEDHKDHYQKILNNW